MSGIIKLVNNILAELCGWMTGVVMLLLLVDVICRTFGTPIMGVAELAMFVMVGTVFAGLANCEMEKGHVRVDSLVGMLPPKGQKIAMAITYGVAALTIGCAAVATCENAYWSFVDNEGIAGAINYPLWPVKFIMALGMILYTLQIVLNMVGEVKKPIEEQVD